MIHKSLCTSFVTSELTEYVFDGDPFCNDCDDTYFIIDKKN